ncbi:oligosaccharide flippase family protein [Peribacillus sp. SCS-37]|uniref:oligosaccharide flippase family protein n=1 Tax=Paraperibacillus esterisolvens TaxID=3115296 RepID=UPI0039069A50
MKSQLKSGAILSYISLMLNSVISIIYTPVMLDLLGQSQYGLFSLASAAVGFVSIINFGLGNAVIRYTAKIDKKDEEARSNLFGTFFIMYVILGLIALIVGIILVLYSHIFFADTLSPSEFKTLKLLMVILVMGTALGIGTGFFSVISLAYEKFIFQKLLTILSAILNPIVMLPLLLLGYESISMAIVTTSISILNIFANMFYCFKILKVKIKFTKFQNGLFKEIITFSSFIFINMIIDKIYWSTDQILLGIYSGTVAISIYTVGATFTGYFSGFATAISNVFLSRVTVMASLKNPMATLSNLFIKLGRIQFIVLSFLMGGFIVYGREFLNLWVGEQYKDSFIVAVLILIPMILSLIQSIGGVILQAMNILKFKTYLYLVIALLNLILSTFLVQKWGAIGCAAATGIAFTIGNIIIMNLYY